MGQYEHFEYDFIERTKANLENYEGDYEVTQMLNSAVGLIMIPQQCLSKQLPNIDIDDSGVFGIYKKDISRSNGGYSIKNILRHLRNGIAHGHIAQNTVQNCRVETIRIQDKNDDYLTFDAVFKPDNFKKFALYIADTILATKA